MNCIYEREWGFFCLKTIMIEINKIYHGDTLATVRQFEAESIDCVITSPPYYQLRDYGFAYQWGLEKTYQEYLDKMIALMSELKRVLKPTGTIWINLGDSYNGNKQGSTQGTSTGLLTGKITHNQVMVNKKTQQMPDKSLMLIPHRFAIRCIDELGLILRNDIIWAKPNGMPESVKDRFTKKHEFFFFFVKQQKYFFDLKAIRQKNLTKCKRSTLKMLDINKYGKNSTFNGGNDYNPDGKNPGDVADFWDITTKPSNEKHYATFNADLIDRPIVAGCPVNGIVLDPFCGTGTTLVRALQLDRKVIGVDGKKEYVKIAEKRIKREQSILKLALN